MTRMIDEQLTELGMSTNLSGYFYFHTALLMVIKNPPCLQRITKTLYPVIAEKYGMTPAAIERAMSHAVKRTWEKGNGDLHNRINKKPTNYEFIAIAADEIMCRMRLEKQKESEKIKNKQSW